MINTIAVNLRRLDALGKLSSTDYADNSVGPYYSSIGNHVRHALDIYKCLIEGLESGCVDLTKRVRGVACETDISEALAYMESIVADIESLDALDNAMLLTLVDDLGEGKVATPATLGSVLFQAHGHAIHHFAFIGYLLHQQNLALPDAAFGYNPTTPI